MEAKGQGHSRQEEGEESEESPQLLLEWIPDCSHTKEHTRIPGLRRLRKEECEFKASLGYRIGPLLQKQTKPKKGVNF